MRIVWFVLVGALVGCAPDASVDVDAGDGTDAGAVDECGLEKQALSLCTEGERRCDGENLLECVDCGRQWVVLEVCAEGCRGGECVPRICEPGALSCELDAIVRCSTDGLALVTEQICDLGCVPGTEATGPSCRACTCSPGVSRCASGTNAREYCTEDCLSWLREECGSETCTESTTGAVLTATCGPPPPECSACVPGAESCSASGEERVYCTAECVLQSEPCAFGCDLLSTATGALRPTCRACQPNAVSCDGDTKVTCNGDGSAATRVACDGACVVDSTGVSCVPRVCTPSAKRCEADALYACNANGTEEVYAAHCPDGCDPGTGSDARCVFCPCQPGQSRCEPGVNAVSRCREDCRAWLAPVSCGEQTCVEGACVDRP